MNKYQKWQMAYVFWKNKWPKGQELLVVMAELKKIKWKEPEPDAFRRGWAAAYVLFSTEMIIMVKELLAPGL